MPNRGGKNKSKSCIPRQRANYVQSVGLTERLTRYYENLIMSMAISRFKWINLPRTCDARYLELNLALNGTATIAFPNDQKGLFLSLQVCGNNRPSMYDVPTGWFALGQNGTRFPCNNRNGVIVYDNSTRYPLFDGISLYARELAQIRMVKRTNRFHQQMPFILKGDQRKRQDMVNLFRNVADGEAAILATNGIEDIDYEVLNTGVDYIAHDIAEDELFVWNQVYQMLGFPALPFKAERQTQDEVMAQTNPSNLVALSSLNERRKAADKLNDRFEKYLTGPDGEFAPISVVFAHDNLSDNFNFSNNLKNMTEMG